MKASLHAVVLVLCIVGSVRAERFRDVRGRVVDENGQPVVGATVADFWTGNGTQLDATGGELNLDTDAGRKEYWGHLGQMEPRGKGVGKTGADGQFAFPMYAYCHVLLAMDQARARGGIGIIAKDDPSAPIEIRLAPLVRVRGAFEGPVAGQKPIWTIGEVRLPKDLTRPLDDPKIVHCGSYDCRFDVSLPPGRYMFQAYDDGAHIAISDKEIILREDTREVDLGTMLLEPVKSSWNLREEAKARGTWGDYTKLYGKHLPAWHAIESRGVNKNVQIADFKGKWVLIDLWGLSCPICLEDKPKLIEFYEQHEKQRDQFEILSICLDYTGELNSLADLDRELKPIVENVWHGKRLPFPLLLDNTFDTWERFGLPGLGVVLLVDPDGNLVEGDETVLATKLK